MLNVVEVLRKLCRDGDGYACRALEIARKGFRLALVDQCLCESCNGYVYARPGAIVVTDRGFVIAVNAPVARSPSCFTHVLVHELIHAAGADDDEVDDDALSELTGCRHPADYMECTGCIMIDVDSYEKALELYSYLLKKSFLIRL